MCKCPKMKVRVIVCINIMNICVLDSACARIHVGVMVCVRVSHKSNRVLKNRSSSVKEGQQESEYLIPISEKCRRHDSALKVMNNDWKATHNSLTVHSKQSSRKHVWLSCARCYKTFYGV